MRTDDPSMILFMKELGKFLLNPNREDKFMQMKIKQSKKKKLQLENEAKLKSELARRKLYIRQKSEEPDSDDSENQQTDATKMIDDNVRRLTETLETLVLKKT